MTSRHRFLELVRGIFSESMRFLAHIVRMCRPARSKDRSRSVFRGVCSIAASPKEHVTMSEIEPESGSGSAERPERKWHPRSDTTRINEETR
jgi:hypothetical protein